MRSTLFLMGCIGKGQLVCWKRGPTSLVTLAAAFRLAKVRELGLGGAAAAVFQGVEGALRALWGGSCRRRKPAANSQVMEGVFVSCLQASAVL
jgi:hypothetical protein